MKFFFKVITRLESILKRVQKKKKVTFAVTADRKTWRYLDEQIKLLEKNALNTYCGKTHSESIFKVITSGNYLKKVRASDRQWSLTYDNLVMVTRQTLSKGSDCNISNIVLFSTFFLILLSLFLALLGS